MVYYCEIIQDDDGYRAEFPDIPNVITCGDTKEETLYNAWEALNGVLEAEVAHGTIPQDSVTGPGEGLYPVEVEPHVAVAIQLRKLRGDLSQSEIAEKLGLTYQAYQRLENPRKGNPTVKTLEKVARILGKKLDITFEEKHIRV